MLGYADEEIEPHISAWERLVHPDDRPRADEANDSVARGDADLRRRVPSAAQGRPLRPRAVARLSGPPRAGRTGRPHRRHALRPRPRRGRAARAHGARNACARDASSLTRAPASFAQEDERRRIAREMHDQFGEQLTALGHRIAALKDACGEPRRPARRRSRRSRRSRSSSIATSITSSGSSGRPRSTISACSAALANYVQDWSTRARHRRRAAHLGAARRSARLRSRDDALPHRAGSAHQRRQALAGASTSTSSSSGAPITSCSSSRTTASDSIRATAARPAGLRPARHAGARGAGRRDARDRIGRRQGHDHPRPHGRRAPAQRQRPTMPEQRPPLRILLADDHVTVRHGLKLLIDSQPDMKVIAEAERRRRRRAAAPSR